MQDYDFRGNIVAAATFLTEPDWTEVLEKPAFAASISAGRKSLSKSYINGNGNVFKTEVYEIAVDGTAGKSATSNVFFDEKGRIAATENSGGVRRENEFDALGRNIGTKTLAGDVVIENNFNTINTYGWDGATYDLDGSLTSLCHYNINAELQSQVMISSSDSFGIESSGVPIDLFALDSISGAIRGCMRLPTYAQRLACLETLLGTLAETGYCNSDKVTKAIENLKNSIIQFGRTANQIYHTFRHTDAAGLPRTLVTSVVQNSLHSIMSRLQPGQTIYQMVIINGKRIEYAAHMLPDGTINVGRITVIP